MNYARAIGIHSLGSDQKHGTRMQREVVLWEIHHPDL